MRRSIRVRLTLWVLAWLVPTAVVAAWLLAQVFAERLLRDIDVELNEEAETVAEVLATDATPAAVRELLAGIAGQSGRGAAKYISITRDGAVLAEMPPNAAALLARGERDLRVGRYSFGRPPTTVMVGTSAAPALHAKARLLSLLVLGTPLVLLAFAAGLWWVVGRMLHPLQQAAAQLDRIEAQSLSVRLPAPQTDDEVGRIVGVINRMLARLEQALGELQRFTADAAHELRTPLAVLRTGLEVALARERPAADYRGALDEALANTDRLCRLSEDLLTLARVESQGTNGAAVNVNLQELLDELADAARDRAPAIEVAASGDLIVHGKPGDLYRLFANLIDNAIRYGRADGVIRIGAARSGEQVRVSVSDSGPGFSPDVLPRLFERFYRGSEKRAADGGSGLGLSIAREIARRHGGDVSAENRAGGACVTVTLPLSPPSPQLPVIF